MPAEDPVRLQRRLRVITTILGVVFISAGLTKWLRLPLWVELFHRFGMPDWSLLIVGTLEVAFATLLVNRPTRPYGAMGLAAMLVGMIMTHVMTGVGLPMMFPNVFLFTGCVWVVIKDRPRFMKLA